MIYSLSCCSKPECIYFFLWNTKEDLKKNLFVHTVEVNGFNVVLAPLTFSVWTNTVETFFKMQKKRSHTGLEQHK